MAEQKQVEAAINKGAWAGIGAIAGYVAGHALTYILGVATIGGIAPVNLDVIVAVFGLVVGITK